MHRRWPRESAFCILLRQAWKGPIACRPPTEDPVDTPAGTRGGTGRERVLIVEDQPDTLRLIEAALTMERYEVVTASDGAEALDAARARRPDVVLLDVMIPKIDGMEVLRRLKADPATRDMMVLLVTAKASLDHRVAGLEAGADDYIPKPFHLSELIARVRSALRIKRLTDDLRERNRKLVASQQRLLQSKKMATIGLLASGIAHEFNNIMTGICGYAQLAKKDPKFRDALVDVALTQTDRALELTRSLSTYNRGATGEGRSEVSRIVENALCLVAKELAESNVQVVEEYLDHPWVQVGPASFQELMLNLILNAIQALEGKNGIVKVRVVPCRDPDMVVVEVSDSGRGIPEENLERIFDPFFTTKGALGGGDRSGTGLGLTVCYNIVSSHGGTIDVSSKVGHGTTFRVAVPRAVPSAETAQPARGREEAAVQEAVGRLRILVIDDDRTVREMIREYLSDHDVIICAGAEEGLAAHAACPFDYVILDVALEGPIDGLQAFDRFSLFVPPPRVVFASGRFPDDIYRGYIARAHGSLIKPFKFEQLLQLLGLPAPQVSAASTAA